MPVIQGTLADQELSQVKAIDDFDVGASAYPYTRLSSDDFEWLNYALFKVSAPIGDARDWDDTALMVRGADAGRDVLLFRRGSLSGVVQCKRLESAIALPAVFREIAKMILFPEADSSLPKIPQGLTYYLSLATDPRQTVIDFFTMPGKILADRRDDLVAAIREVLEKYDTLGGLDEAEASAVVMRILPSLNLRLLRPVDLNAWMAEQTGVATRFYRHRILVDSTHVDARLTSMEELLRATQEHLGGVPFITDVDLKIIRARIEGTPETHRLSVGFASLFGFPREMFAGEANLRQRVGRLAEMLNGLNSDYTDWLHKQARDKASEICDKGEVVWRVHPFARQVPVAFLGLVATEILNKVLSGQVMGEIIRKLNQGPVFQDDSERFAWLREKFLADGRRYLAEDFSQLQGDADLIELKKRILKQAMHGLNSDADIARALDEGIDVLRPYLTAEAADLRRLGAYAPSVFLMGMTGLDVPDVVERLAESVKGVEAMNLQQK